MEPKERRAAIINQAARAIGTNPAWLDALINFETGGTYDPQIANPRSSARGLIQLINASARDLGFADSTAAVTEYSDFESQMFNVVVPYFDLKARQEKIGSYGTKQALYMAVFYPAYWDKPANMPFPESVQQNNPGIRTPQDYIDFVDRRIKTETLAINPWMPALVKIAGAGLLIYAAWRLYQS